MIKISGNDQVQYSTTSKHMSKTRHQNGKKNNNTSSQMLLDHCYTFGLLLWPSNSEEVVLWRRVLVDLLWPCPGSTTVRNCAQKSIQMCGSHEYSQILVDNCYAFSLLLQHSTLKEKFFGEGAPHWRIMTLLWICP